MKEGDGSSPPFEYRCVGRGARGTGGRNTEGNHYGSGRTREKGQDMCKIQEVVKRAYTEGEKRGSKDKENVADGKK